MAKNTPMNIEEIRSIERIMFWMERLAMFLILIFANKPLCFNSGSALFVFTNSVYISLFVQRLMIRPYPYDADELFYAERLSVVYLASCYALSTYVTYAWMITAAAFMITNFMYVIICFEPKQEKQMTSTTHGPCPKETDDGKELKKGKAEIDDEPPKEKHGYGTCSWDPLKIENVEHEVNHDRERSEIEDNLEGEKVTYHEEEPKKAEDIYDAELLETDEISNASEGSWEDIDKKDEEKAAIDQEISNASEGSWEDVEEKDEEKAAIDQEDEVQVNCDDMECDDMETWEDVQNKDEEKYQKDELLPLERVAGLWHLERVAGLCHQDYTNLNQDHINLINEVQQWKCSDAFEAEASLWYEECVNPRERFHEQESAKLVSSESLVPEHEADRVQWEEDKKELIANITATLACSTDKIIEATEQFQAMNHKWEEEKNDLSAKLEAVTESIEHYRGIEKDFEVERLKWNEERDDLNAKLATTNSWYQHYLQLCYDLSSKLFTASSSADYSQACHNDTEERCRKLKEENLDLSAKLCAETSLAVYYHDLMHEFDDKCKRLEEDKTNLTSKLCAEQASAELYRRCMRDFGA